LTWRYKIFSNVELAARQGAVDEWRDAMTDPLVPQLPADPGRLMAREIAEQPAMFDRILAHGRADIARVAGEVAAAGIKFVLLAARGTSDHAALYAKYLVEIVLGLPAGLASPSTMTAYGARPDLRDVLFIAVSQSGGSPDLVQSLTTARACGALTLAVTNAPTSPLAAAAALHVDVLAGPERAVAATKSYTAELLSLYLLVDALRGGDGSAAGVVAGAAGSLIDDPEPVRALARRFMGAERLVVTGRGYSYPTAREAALKLMETSYVSAQAFSGADLMHGPMAMLQRNSAVIAIAPGGVAGRAIAPVVDRLIELGTNLAIVGAGGVGATAEHPAGLGGRVVRLKLPTGVSEELSPVVEIIPLQMLAHELAVVRGFDPDTPRGLHKVTETW
jgi:glucosamine--fructose-6-phosphate aminotransferase (isomerizing)